MNTADNPPDLGDENANEDPPPVVDAGAPDIDVVFCVDCGYHGHKSKRAYAKCPQTDRKEKYNGKLGPWGSKAPENYRDVYAPPSSLVGAPKASAFSTAVWEDGKVLKSHGYEPPKCTAPPADVVNPELGFSIYTKPWELYKYFCGTVEIDGEEVAIQDAQVQWTKVSFVFIFQSHFLLPPSLPAHKQRRVLG